jgi:hypothetical protein
MINQRIRRTLMKLKTKTGEMLVLDEEQTAWKG